MNNLNRAEIGSIFNKKFLFQVFSIGAIFLFLLSNIFQPDLWSVKTANAAVNFGSGFYTKLCGDFNKPNGDINGVDGPHACQNKCDIGSGTCSGNSVYRFECDGKQTDCRSNSSGSSTSQSLNRPGLCNKTVQIDVYRRDCLASGDCNDRPSFEPEADLQDFIVWYSGDCAPTPTPTSAPAPQAPACDGGQLNMSVSPNPVNMGDSVTFTLGGSQGSTWIDDSWSGGVDCSVGFWGSKTCRATSPGNFVWTHFWQNTAPNNFDIRSPQCSKTVNFSVQAVVAPPPPPPVCVSNGSCSAPAPTCGTTTTGVDNCGNTCSKQGAVCSPIVPPPPAGAPNLQCPAGFTQEVRDSTIVCVQNTNTNTSSSSSSSSATGGSSTVTVTAPAPQVILASSGNVGVAGTAQVLGVTTLPKTGLPALAWAALAFIPAGFGMRRFRSGVQKTMEDDPNYIWENRKFKTGS